jgi:hypothetical protein
LGFPTGWSFTTHKESSGAINHAPAGVEADLWSITAELGTASSDGKRAWPELGFRWLFTEEERDEGEVAMGNLGFALAAEGYL